MWEEEGREKAGAESRLRRSSPPCAAYIGVGRRRRRRPRGKNARKKRLSYLPPSLHTRVVLLPPSLSFRCKLVSSKIENPAGRFYNCDTIQRRTAHAIAPLSDGPYFRRLDSRIADRALLSLSSP